MLKLDRSVFIKSRKGKEIKKTIVKVPSDSKYIRKISAKILHSLVPYNVSDSRVFDIRLCTEEAVRNAIVHGNKSNKKLSVTVAYWVENDKLTIEVEDEGPGFNPTNLPDPTQGDNVTRNSGRGVYLMHRLADSVEYNETGNKMKMVKSLK